LTCASLRFYEPCHDCPDEATCLIRKSLIEVRDQTLTALEKTTIKMLTGE
jgi:DNA-binding IscR family transcriptional regulator